MSWTDNLGKIAKDVADFTGIPGLIHDMSNTLSNDDPWYVDGINLVKNVAKVGTTPVRGAVKGLFYVGEKSYEAGGVVREKMAETLLDTPLMYNKYKNPGESYEDYRTRVAANKEQISLGQASLALLSPGKNAADRSGWFADALDNNLAFLSGGFDIFDAKDREVAFNDQFTGKFLSGAQDLVASTVIDPLTFTGFLGKGAVIASKGLMYENINGKLARTVFGKAAMTNDKMDNLLERALKGEGAAVKDVEFLAQTDAKGQYGYWAKKKVTNPDALAYMFGKAQTKEEVVATFRAVMLKDTKAMSEIAEKDSELALMIDNMSDGATHPQRQLMDGKLDGDVLTTPEYNNAVGTYIEDLKKTDPAFLASYDKVATGRPFRYGFEKEFLQKSRLGAVNRAEKMAARTFGDPESITYLKTSLHPLVKIVHFFKEDVPSGVFNVNDGNSYMEFNTFLRQTNDLSGGKFQESSRELADRYLAAALPAERLDIIKEAERRAINTLFPAYDQDTLDKIYKIYDARRASLIDRHNNQGFLGYFDGDQFVNAKSPLLERQGANTVIIADLARLKQGIDAHERVLPTILQGIDVDNLAIRTNKSMAALDTINDIFKTSVLMRLGYTVRNLTEAQLSMMAKGFALPSMVASGGKDAVGRFFNNRKAGVNRLVDNLNVVTGKADDFNVIQHEIGSQFDMLRSVDMGRQQLAKEVAVRIAELEGMRVGKTVRGFTKAITSDITGEAAITVDEAEKFAFEVELRTLKGVLADLESVTLYHGAPGLFNLDKTRALATSASPAIARRYAEGGTLHSVEQYIPTPTGRMGRLGEKPVRTPGAEAGTTGVIEQMPLAEFEEVKQYVRGGYTETQLDLRDPDRWGTTNQEKIPAMLQRAIQRSVIKENTVVYRGTSNPDILNAKLGDIIVEKGFTSTSKEYKVAEKFAGVGKEDSTIVRIQLPKGANGLDIVASYRGFSKLDSELSKTQGIESKLTQADITGEREVLLPANTKFEVVSVVEGQPATKDFPAIKPVYTLRAIVEEPKLPSPKRQDVLNEATLRLQSDMIDAVNAGKVVEYKDSAGQWKKVKSIDYETLILAADTDEAEVVLFKNWSNRPIFRVNATKGSVQPYRVYGKPLYLQQWSDIPVELRDAAFGGKITNFKSWIKTKGWNEPNDPVFKYMRENGYGRAVVADDKRAGGLSHIALPESIGEKGRTAEVDAYIKSKMEKEVQVWEMDATAGLEPRFDTPKARRAEKRFVGKKARLQKKDYAVSPYYAEDSVHAMINNGIEDAAANLARDYAQAHAHLDDLFSRLGAVIDRAESTAIKQRAGFGTFNYEANGINYTLPKAFEEASWFLGRTSAESTWNALVSSQEMAFTAGIGSRSVRTIDPADPKYFEGWANILNMHFRDPESGIMDPVVRMILDGEDNAKILNWFHTSKGAMYATEAYTLVGSGKGVTKLKGGELDEHLMAKLHETRQAVASYIPDNETALMLSAAKETGKPLSGGEVQQFLVERFGKNPENLKPLNGMLVTSSKEYKDQERLIDTINRRVMRFLGSMPEDVFARHPLTVAIYEKELRLNMASMADAAGKDRLTPDEINRAVSNARETARQEVERTLFTIVRRTGASSSRSMKLLFPFYAAYENTLKRWGGMSMENPALVTTAARTIAQVVNGQMIVDRDGNRLTSPEQLQGNQGANLVVSVPQSFIDALPAAWKPIVENSFKNINIPLASLDVITQGQVGNPGFGPYATLPAYLVLKQRPELEDALKPFFPVGAPQSATDIFTPSVIRRLNTVWRQDELYVRSYNQMLRYETYLYNQGKRTDAPTPSEIKDKTNKFFFLRALTSISAPFAIAPEVDFYAQTFRQYQSEFADYRDPTTGKRVYGMAEAKFLEQYPDFFEATVSLSKNEGGLEPSIQTVRNLRKHSDLMAYADGKGDPELIGFLADDGDDAYTFSQAAYQWQYNHGATPGGGSTYRQNRTPGELLREANIKRGWAEYQQLEQAINTYKIQNGITDDKDPQMKVVKQAKSIWIQQKSGDNLDWYSEYVSPDRAKYARRADVLDKALKDKKWMAQNGNRAVVKSMALYLEARNQIGEILKQRDTAGGSRSMDANSNADIAAAFDMFRTNLIAGSPEFEQFINRYFANDTVVI
jgi:hypothetical protein